MSARSCFRESFSKGTRRLWALASLAALLGPLAAMAAPPPPPAETPPPPPAESAKAPPAQTAKAPSGAAATPQAAAPEAADPSYLIGPGDVIQVFVWRNPELTVIVPVRPDGKISSPLVEDMVAVGKTPTQLARDIEHVLSEYVRSPEVNIIVTNAQSAFNQVKVIGQVARPASIAYRRGMTALDAMLDVGGLTTFASGNRAKILRKDASGNQQVIRVRLDDLMKKGRAADNPLLQPGDVLVVPESLF